MQPPHLGAVLVHLAILQDGVLLVIDHFLNFLIQRAKWLEMWSKSRFTIKLFIEQNREEGMVMTRYLACKAQETDLVIG